MIFIITPFLHDFRKVCLDNKLECKINFNGLPSNKNIRWINTWERLIGLRIKADDPIYYGEQINAFKPKELERIKYEIELRKKVT